MGEWSKKIGEYGEKIVEEFLYVVGWHDLIKGEDIKCIDEINQDEGDLRKTYGVDFTYSYLSPLVSGQWNNIIISSKYSTEKYPNSATEKFKSYIKDVANALKYYDYSVQKQEILSGQTFSTVKDIGVLFWLNNNPDSTDDLIANVASARISETLSTNTIYIMDNKRVSFVLEVMKFIKTKTSKYDYSFYYPNTGQNINPLTRDNVGKILPVEYLNSTIIPIKLMNKDNPKETILFIATLDSFDSDDLMRLMGLAKDISTQLVGEIIIAFPDYDEPLHKNRVAATKQKFQASELAHEFTRTISVINFLNPIEVFR